MTEKQFGKFIRESRKQKGLTTSELAKTTGISQSYISQIETGNRGIPTEEILLKFAKGLDIDYSEVINKAGKGSKSAFDPTIRRFVHMLFADHPFSGKIQSEFWDRLDQIALKYNMKTSKKVDALVIDKIDQIADMILDMDDIQYKWDVLQELQSIAHKFYLWFDPAYEGGMNLPPAIRLEELLQQSNITYNSNQLSEDDRKRILDMLAVLFPDQK